ncbi:hypothetical protein [Tenacibaculum retecalamus]|uniref:hypothetical protein n=1 Tax=Tenacibaculum retecalamus TaxID=3018315 RepID=UPI0023D8FE05|nr:hypothetical protein [Tenacibaculum retecalamus]WBX71760.1 hypothetical protein PG912_02935 [Tenacibaculum retecalamus]
MDKKNYIQILEKPVLISQEISAELKNVIQQYPYFQSARALQLKTLKSQHSFKYNNELKNTAAYTTDRTVLFDFITSETFKENSTVKEEKIRLREIILPKKKTKEITKIKEELSIGKPLSFSKQESFSFNQWMQLSSKNTIIRETAPDPKKIIPAKSLVKKDIIDRFIASSPKIPRPSKTNPTEIKLVKSKKKSQLATETLAKVYLEQKKYDSAIQAYKILSLKYPEKSGFFADQIKRIQILQKNK